jgi:hypothetical protein
MMYLLPSSKLIIYRHLTPSTAFAVRNLRKQRVILSHSNALVYRKLQQQLVTLPACPQHRERAPVTAPPAADKMNYDSIERNLSIGDSTRSSIFFITGINNTSMVSFFVFLKEEPGAMAFKLGAVNVKFLLRVLSPLAAFPAERRRLLGYFIQSDDSA